MKESNAVYLRIKLDTELWYRSHISETEAKANVMRSIAGREWGDLVSCLKTTFLSAVRPHLEYSVPVWAHAAKSNLDKLDRIQYAAGRIIIGATRSTSTDYVEHEAKLIHLNKRREEIILKYGNKLNIFVKSCLDNEMAQDFSAKTIISA